MSEGVKPKNQAEVEKILCHTWFRRLVNKKDIDILYKKEFSSAEVITPALIGILEEESDCMIDLLLTSWHKGYFSLTATCSILTNCFIHLKMLDFYTFLDKPFEQDTQVSIKTILNHQKKKYQYCAERFNYLKLFTQLTTQFEITHLSFKYGKDVLMVSYYCTSKGKVTVGGFSIVHKNPPVLDKRTQVRRHVLSKIYRGFYLQKRYFSDYTENATMMAMTIRDVEKPRGMVSSKEVTNELTRDLETMFKLLNIPGDVLDQDTAMLVGEYLYYVLILLECNETIMECFNPQGRYAHAVQCIETPANFKLYDGLATVLKSCKNIKFLELGKTILLSSFVRKNQRQAADEDQIYIYQIILNLGRGISAVRLSEDVEVCYLLLISLYQDYKDYIPQKTAEDDYLEITQTLMNYRFVNYKTKYPYLRDLIIKYQTPHHELFATAIDSFLGNITKSQAKKKLQELNQIYRDHQNPAIKQSQLFIAEYADDKKLAVRQSGTPLERFDYAFSKKKFRVAERIYEEHREQILKEDEFSDRKAIAMYLRLGKYDKAAETLDSIQFDSFRAFLYIFIALRLEEPQQDFVFKFLERALTFKHTVEDKMYYAILHAGLQFSLKWKNDEKKWFYVRLSRDFNPVFGRECAKELLNGEYRDQRDVILELAGGDTVLIEECHRNYKRLRISQPEDPRQITWMVNGQVLDQKGEIYCFEDGARVKKYGYIDPKLMSKVNRFQAYANAMKSGVAQRAIGRDGIKFVYSKSRGNYSGHKIKIGEDGEVYGNTVVVKTDMNGVEHQLHVFDRYGNHQNIKNYFELNPSVRAIEERTA